MPDWKPAIRERLAGLASDGAWQAEVTEELEQHLEDRYRELLRNGAADDEAQRRAIAELQEGGALRDQLMKIARPVRPPDWGAPLGGASRWHALAPDLRLAFRSILARPAFSFLVIGMLALGIAGNSAIFSIFNGLFLRPLPFAESDRLVDLDETAPKWNLTFVGVNNPDFDAWSHRNQSFESMAFFTESDYNLAGQGPGQGDAQRVRGAQVTAALLDVLRLQPVVGRNFQSEEDRPGGAKVVMIGYGLWQRLFNGSPDVLGRVLRLNEEPYTVVGVLPREALFPTQVELWVPLAADPKTAGSWYLSGIGRLKPGVTATQASADLNRVHKGMIATGFPVNEITSPTVMSLRDRYLGDFRPVSRILLAGVGVVLLIACVNIAALMMVRGAARSREIAIRTAIGAVRSRIVQQLLTETAVLAAIGGVAGVALGAGLLRLLLAVLPQGIPDWIAFPMDLRFVLFAMAVTCAAALLFGLAPALEASGAAGVRLTGATSRASLSPARRRVLSGLVVCEIGLALMLLIGAGLLLSAFHKVTSVDPGFRAENVLTFSVDLPKVKYPKPEQQVAFFDDLLSRLRALPGVQSAGAASAPPLGGHSGYFFEAEGVTLSQKEANQVVLRVTATPGYFEAIGMTFLAGTPFTAHNGDPKGVPSVIVNESFARRYWPGTSAIGKRIRYSGSINPWMEVIGVTKDEKHYGLDQPMRPAVFVSLRAAPRQSMALVLRTGVEPASLTSPSREVLRQLDADLPMYAVRTMQDRVDRSLGVRRGYSWLFGAFAGVALLLAAAGIYGVISYAVSQRTQEIGIRIALGAQPGQVMGEVLRGGMLLVAAGVVLGLAGALGAARLLETLLFGVSWHDLRIYGAVIAGVALVGLAANVLPARRAATVDPIRALRFE